MGSSTTSTWSSPPPSTIGADGHGEIAYGAMQASLELESAARCVFFTWAGFDEGDEIAGSGSAELNDDGTIEVAFAYHLGDEAVLKAERMTSSTACSEGRWTRCRDRTLERPAAEDRGGGPGACELSVAQSGGASM